MTVKYGLLTAEDEWTSEFEVYDFLYGLARLLKPKIVLETGCYKGGATLALGKAVRDNGIGCVITCDTDSEKCDISSGYVADIPVSVHCMEGVSAAERFSDVDLAFIDSSGDRVREVAALKLSPNGVVVLHDSNRPQYKPIWTLRPWKAIWHINTEQGITVFQL